MPTHRQTDSGSDIASSRVPADAFAGSDSSTFTRLFPLDDSSVGNAATSGDVAGLQLAHFVLEERIGRGGMGAVFRAIDQQLDRVVALKVLAPEHSRDPAAVQRFHNEARAAARLDHENIARAYFFGEDQGLQFIAFEFVRGTNIRDFILQKGMLAPTEVVNYAMQITQALRHTHAAGVVHRDIKPSNIIITPSGRAKLVDLGLARQENGTTASQDLTVAGTTLGTFDYIAPEQARDPRNVDVRADIYSLGCTLYHMLTGEPPFPNGSMIQKVVNHHRGAAPDPAALNAAVPPQLSRIVQRMMASNPDERYSTPDHLVNELALVAHALGLRPEHPDGLVWTTPLFSRPSMIWLFWRQNRAWLLTMAALLVIVVGINKIPGDQLVRVDAAMGPEASSPSRTVPDDNVDEPRLIPPYPVGPLLVSGPTPESPAVTDSRVNPGAAETDSPDLPLPVEMALSPNATSSAVGADIERSDPVDQEGIPSDPSATATANLGPFVLLEGDTERPYSSLEAACLDASNDARIELRFDGEWPVPQGPIMIADKRVVISGQPGSRPRLVFAAPVQVGLSAPTQMIRVREGSLQLNDVDIVMHVENIPSDDDWAMIVLDLADRIRMRGVSIRVINPDAIPVSVIELAEPTDADLERMNLAMGIRRIVGIEFEDCLVTGRCDLLRQNTIDPPMVSLRNVAAALRGTLLRIPGGLERTADIDQLSRIELRHVSAILEEGLLRVDMPFAGDLVPMDVVCEQSLMVIHPEEPLIEMSGHQSVDFLRSSLQFQDTFSYFDMRDPAWVLSADGGVFPEEINYRQFGSQDDSVLVNGLLPRSIDWDSDEFTEFGPEEFILRTASTEPSGPNDAFIGVRWPERLPGMTPDPED